MNYPAHDNKVNPHELDPNHPAFYPESDGEPLAENTLHLNWIVTIFNALTVLYKDREDVFVAADLLWYPEKGNRSLCRAPDTMVVFGRPKRHMEKVGAWVQCLEDDQPPHVVFEVRSPSDTPKVLSEKFMFYNQYGVEEYYLCDPETRRTRGWIRKSGELIEILSMAAWVSPRLKIKFQSGSEQNILLPNGKSFLNPTEIHEEWEREREALVAEKEEALVVAEREKQARLEAHERAEREKQARLESDARAEQTSNEARKMKELLIKMGVDLNSALS